jgi:hypothetical protein
MPNGHNIYKHFPFQGTPKYTQFGIFGMKMYQHFLVQGTPKYTQFCDFLYENVPTGNPVGDHVFAFF